MHIFLDYQPNIAHILYIVHIYIVFISTVFPLTMFIVDQKYQRRFPACENVLNNSFWLYVNELHKLVTLDKWFSLINSQ